MNARPVHQMPRRNRRQQNQRDLDFEIHEDPPATSEVDETEARDFASALHARRFSNDGYDYHTPRFFNGTTDSNLTKSSTLVNETGDEDEAGHTISSIMDDLQAEKEKLAAAAAPDPNDRIEEDETFGGEMEPDEKAMMDSELEDSASRRESSSTHSLEEGDTAASRRESGISATSSHKSGTVASESRRESILSTTSSHLSGHETSESRRESGISSTSHRTGTDASDSRRVSESAISLTSEHSSDYSGHYTEHAEEGEASFAETSLHEDAATEDTASRRESTVSATSHSTHDRQTDVSDSRRESTASGITHDQYTERSESRRESTMSGSTHDQYTEASASRRESAYSAVSRDHGSDASASRRESAVSGVSYSTDRRSSGRTEALIQKAARDIITEIEKQKGRLSPKPESVDGRQSSRSESRASSNRQSDAHASIKDNQSVRSDSRMSDARPSDVHSVKDNHSTRSNSRMTNARPSEDHESIKDYRSNISGSRPPSARPSDMHTPVPDDFRATVEDEEEELGHNGAADEAEDNNSSQNEHDDDVFSDHSPRSSVGSMSEAEHRKLEDTVTHRHRSTRSSRMSDFSRLEDDQDEEEDFIPTVRGTPRPPFRSPSSVRALQMSSPPPSVIGSPRSSKRTPLPTVSRLGSPMSGMQYSPKKTPPRFKRNTPPLVLLHVTLLPLQWPWGHVLENAHPDDLSQGAKNVRDTWRQLQDRMGDTTCERGILLPHPQEDFEILEERLLEALELPLRRRARILECGHYLGPSNEMTLEEESDTEDEYPESLRHLRSAALERQTHWCGTCQSEIRYDALGAGKVFRIKIYASNGLMKAGAWEACWKEMERVDVELEPIVEPAVQDEISRHALEQEKAMELHQADEEEGELPEEPNASFLEQESSVIYNAPSSPPPPETRVMMSAPPSAPPPGMHEDERRWRDEQRLREIYGHTPSGQHAEHGGAAENTMPSSEYTHRDTPASPSAEAYARREERRQQAPKTDSLPGLLLEAFKVMMQDKKNVMIAIMGVLVLVLALRVGAARDAHRDALMFQPVMEAPTVTVTERAADQQQTTSVVPSVESVSSASVATPSVADVVSENADPDGEKEDETTATEKIIRVVETVTEVSVMVETATVTAPEAATETPAPVEQDTQAQEETIEEKDVEVTLEDGLLEKTEQTVGATEKDVTLEGGETLRATEEVTLEDAVLEKAVEDEVTLEDALEQAVEEETVLEDAVLEKVEEIPEVTEKNVALEDGETLAAAEEDLEVVLEVAQEAEESVKEVEREL